MNLDKWEQEQLKKMTNCKFESVLFDTDKDNWKKFHMSVIQHFQMNCRTLMVIEDTENNKFGYFYDENLKFMHINSKLFTLKRNGERKFGFYNDEDFFYRECTQKSHNPEINCLICLGAGNQIMIGDENNLDKSYCQQNDYFVKYKGEKDVFTGKSGKENPFTPKRITVISLCLSFN